MKYQLIKRPNSIHFSNIWRPAWQSDTTVILIILQSCHFALQTSIYLFEIYSSSGYYQLPLSNLYSKLKWSTSQSNWKNIGFFNQFMLWTNKIELLMSCKDKWNNYQSYCIGVISLCFVTFQLLLRIFKSKI